MSYKYKNMLPPFLSVLIVFLVNNSSLFDYFSVLFSGLLVALSLFVLFYLSVKLLVKPTLNKNFVFIFVSFVVFGAFLFLLSFQGPSPMLGMQRAFQAFCVLGILYYGFYLGVIGLAPRVLEVIVFVFFVLLVVHTALYLAGVNYSDHNNYSGLLLNSNVFGMWVVTFGTIALGVVKNRLSIIAVFILVLFLVLASGSRSSLLALVVALSIYIISWRVVRAVLFKYSFLLFICAFSIGVIYATLFFDLGQYNQDVVDVTGKNLQSGRHLIWPAVMEQLMKTPWFGLGSGASLSDIVDRSLSSHNAFLQTLMQNGFVGLVLMVLVIFSVYFSIFKISSQRYFKLALASFSVLLIIQSFEVTIFQNNLALSYPVWVVVGLLLGSNTFEKRRGNEYDIPSSATSQS